MLVTSLRFLFFFTVRSFNIFSVSHPAAAASQAFPSLKVGGKERRVRAGANKLYLAFFGSLLIRDRSDRHTRQKENLVRK